MIVTKTELIETIRSWFGENPSDDQIELIENISDTLSDYEEKTADSTNWKEKYDTLDKTWREKYVSRFGETGLTSVEDTEDIRDTEKDVHNIERFDDLFD